jgi:uncharacterized damage-inducible protein DinB
MKLLSRMCVLLAAVGLVGAMQGQTAAAPEATIASIVTQAVNRSEQNVLGAAEAMPAEKYNFAPTAGTFTGVRTFAQQVKHVAFVNYLFWGPVAGEKAPFDLSSGKVPDTYATKAQIVQLLKDSYEVGYRAAAKLTSANATQAITIPTPFGPYASTRLGVATQNVEHTYDHYGQMVEYLRMNGVTPPANWPAVVRKQEAGSGN